MRSTQSLVTLVLFLFLFGLPAAPARAQADNSVYVQFLINRGKVYYENGDTMSAIHEFTKAVMVDPGNAEAQAFLRKMGADGGYWGAPRQSMKDIEELAKEMGTYNEKIGRLTSENKLRRKENRSLKARVRELFNRNKVLASAEKQLTDRISRYENQLEETKMVVVLQERENKELVAKVKESEAEVVAARRTLAEKEQEIARLSGSVFDLKDQLVAKIALIREKESVLKGLTRDNQSLARKLATREKDWLAQGTRYQQEIKDLEKVFARYQAHRDDADETYNAQIRHLHEIIRKNRIELAFLNDRLLFTEFKLTGREAQLAGKNEVVSKLKTSLLNLEHELASFQANNLPQEGQDQDKIVQDIKSDIKKEKIIKAKNLLIRQLKTRLAKAQNRIAELNRNDRQLAALKDNLQSIKRQLEAQQTTYNKKEMDSAFLKAQIQEIQQQLELLEGLMAVPDSKIPAPSGAAPQAPGLSLLSR